MSTTCAICDKKKSVGNLRKLLRGHRNVTAKRTFKPNLQKISYQGRKVLACTKCLKTINRKGSPQQKTA